MSPPFAARFRGRALVDVFVAVGIGVASGYLFWVPALEEYHRARRRGADGLRAGDGASGALGPTAAGRGAGGAGASGDGEAPPVERLR